MSKDNGGQPKKLSTKHEVFCQRYVSNSYNATEAYNFTYGSPKGAGQSAAALLRNPKVQDRIEELMDGGAKRAELTAAYVLEGLQRNAERSMQEVPVLDSDGNAIGVYTYQGNVANKAYELLGKHLRLFDEQVWVGNEQNRPQPGVQLMQRVPVKLLKDGTDG